MIPDDSLCIVDRGLLPAPAVLPYSIQGSNQQWLTRAKKNAVMRVVQGLGTATTSLNCRFRRKLAATIRAFPRNGSLVQFNSRAADSSRRYW